ncbi:MAG: hypothetical protein WBD70_25385 [Mycobacterium sp.]
MSNRPVIVPDDEGGAIITQAIHLTDADINRLIAATGRRVSPAKARMLRYRVKASTDA